MALEEYRRKRDFTKTKEPKPEVAKRSKEPIFVIQEHHATRLHYDLRLEADGVLKSWAVTKEPTMDSSIRRLAIETEDHPMAYADFHGDIPEGEYGAGHVEIWDRGTFANVMAEKPEPLSVSESIELGHVEFELHGSRLNGRFVLIRTDGNGPKSKWLLIKMKDGQETSRSGAETSKGTTESGRTERGPARRGGSAATGKRPAPPRVIRKGEPPATVKRTSEDKVMFPEAGITKGQILDYYERVAPLMLPHLENRPVTLERLPDGLKPDAPRFWQKNTPGHYPGWIPRVELPTEEGKPARYALVNDVQTLLYLVNQGAITFHVWMSRIQNLDRPDYLLFDLDPGERPFEDVIIVARKLHALLDAWKIESAVKTSGKSGLHVTMPWKERGGYDEARDWAMAIAEDLVGELPDIATVERSKAKRKGRLYVDVMQNARGHHAVAPYTIRATPTATVSTPLTWGQVRKGLRPERMKYEV